MVQTKPKSKKQISARLNPTVHRALQRRLAKDRLSQQDFISTVVELYVTDQLKLIKSIHLDLSQSDELHLQLKTGEGYGADSIEDLMDQLEGRTAPKPIKS
jgi:hypothetical protein